MANRRQATLHWTLAAPDPASTSAPAGTSPDNSTTGGAGTGPAVDPSTGPASAPSGPIIAIVTDLLADHFTNGKLKQVFVVFQPGAGSASSTRLSFYSAHQ